MISNIISVATLLEQVDPGFFLYRYFFFLRGKWVTVGVSSVLIVIYSVYRCLVFVVFFFVSFIPSLFSGWSDEILMCERVVYNNIFEQSATECPDQFQFPFCDVHIPRCRRPSNYIDEKRNPLVSACFLFFSLKKAYGDAFCNPCLLQFVSVQVTVPNRYRRH